MAQKLDISLNDTIQQNCYLAVNINPAWIMNRIKEVLGEKEITQTWLAKELGKSYNMVNSYVQNRRQPSIEVLFKIAQILQVDVRMLLMENEIKND